MMFNLGSEITIRPMVVRYVMFCPYDRLDVSTHWNKQAETLKQILYCLWLKCPIDVAHTSSQCNPSATTTWVLLWDLQNWILFIIVFITFPKHMWEWRGNLLTPTCRMDGFSSYREIFSCPLAFVSSGGRRWPGDLQHKHIPCAC